MAQLCFNGTFQPDHQPLFSATNRGFRYGDGLFETIRLVENTLPLAPLHWDRLQQSLALMGLDWPLPSEELSRLILELAGRNGCAEAGRIRVTIYRESGRQASCLIEAGLLAPSYSGLLPLGFRIDLYPFARKACDAFASLKSANHLPYVLAGQFAEEQGLDECLVLNSAGRIADGSRTNLFLVRKGALYTPALHEGCVNGVMRRYLIETLKKTGLAVHLSEISEEELLDAEEAFLTNALIGLWPVASFREKTYGRSLTEQIYHTAVSTIFPPFC